MQFQTLAFPRSKEICATIRLTLSTEGLDDEQIKRLEHHLKASALVFQASAKSMLKGVKKYGPEPHWQAPVGIPEGDSATEVLDYWLPNIFSEMVDGANQVALMSDTLGVDL